MSRLRFLIQSFLVAALLLAAGEGVLRLAGFRREAAPVVLRFGYPDPREITDLFRPDARLFWRMKPGTLFDAEGAVRINARGYRGPVPAEPRPDGLSRVAVLGDSVAFGSAAAWPEILSRRLARAVPRRPVEVLNFGVPGYSIVQGWTQFQQEVAPLRPDVVIIAYGWNDHWLARGGLPDADRRFPSPALVRVGSALSRLRLFQAIRAMSGPREPAAGGASSTPRVPPGTYADRLGALIAGVRAVGAVPIVVCLPSGMSRANEVPGYLLDGGFVAEAGDAIEAHHRYCGIAEEIARGSGVSWVDLRASFGGAGGGPDPRFFSGDRIHLSTAGHERLAEALEAPVAGILQHRAAPGPREAGR